MGGINKSTLIEVFGEGVAGRIRSIAQNLAAMASGKPGAVLGVGGKLAKGGILKKATKVASNYIAGEAGLEAYVPLENGAIPVKLKGQSGNVVNNTFGDFIFTVRDDNDIEEIKKAIIQLRTGVVSFSDSPHNYTERF